jgi:hypothetical protein
MEFSPVLGRLWVGLALPMVLPADIDERVCNCEFSLGCVPPAPNGEEVALGKQPCPVLPDGEMVRQVFMEQKELEAKEVVKGAGFRSC